MLSHVPSLYLLHPLLSRRYCQRSICSTKLGLSSFFLCLYLVGSGVREESNRIPVFFCKHLEILKCRPHPFIPEGSSAFGSFSCLTPNENWWVIKSHPREVFHLPICLYVSPNVAYQKLIKFSPLWVHYVLLFAPGVLMSRVTNTNRSSTQQHNCWNH